MNSDFSIAVHALVYLHHKQRAVPGDELADNICTNPVRIRKVMTRLKRAAIVETPAASSTAYRLLIPGKDIPLSLIAQALDTRFVSTRWSSGDINKKCLVSSGMGPIMGTLVANMNNRCLEYLGDTTVADVEDEIFQPQSPTLES